MSYLLLGLGVLGAVIILMKWYSMADVQALKSFWKWFALVGGGLLLALLFIKGGLSWLLFGLPALIPMFLRWRAAANAAKTFGRMAGSAGGRGTGQTSEIETRILKMSLNHDTGEMAGRVLTGRFEGMTLGDLSRSELLAVLDDCRRVGDQSAQLMESYLDRMHPDWRDGEFDSGHETSGPEPRGAMSREQAYQVLGLEPDATASDIKKAYQRIIANLHPDAGGSDFLAAQVNQARDVLLKD